MPSRQSNVNDVSYIRIQQLYNNIIAYGDDDNENERPGHDGA
jgi:hypothetical protein